MLCGDGSRMDPAERRAAMVQPRRIRLLWATKRCHKTPSGRTSSIRASDTDAVTSLADRAPTPRVVFAPDTEGAEPGTPFTGRQPAGNGRGGVRRGRVDVGRADRDTCSQIRHGADREGGQRICPGAGRMRRCRQASLRPARDGGSPQGLPGGIRANPRGGKAQCRFRPGGNPSGPGLPGGPSGRSGTRSKVPGPGKGGPGAFR